MPMQLFSKEYSKFKQSLCINSIMNVEIKITFIQKLSAVFEIKFEKKTVLL